MARIQALCPPFLGHLNPMLALLEELARRGHQVGVVAQADVRARVERAGLGFAAVGLGSHPSGSLAATLQRIGAVRGLSGIGAVIQDGAAATAMLCRDAPAALGDADLVIADQLEAAGGLLAAHLRRPWVSVANGLLIDREDDVPPPVTGFAPGLKDWHRQRNRGATRVIDWMMRPLGRVIAERAEAWGLTTPDGRPWRTQADALSPFAEISQTTAAFDWPRRAAPPVLHHTGPLRPPLEEEASLEPLDPGRPYLFVSLGTLLGRRLDLFTAIGEAARSLGLSCLIAHCGGLDPEQAKSLEKYGVVTDFAPQHAAIAGARAVISHAGMNTVMDALAAGKPMLAIPLAFDHPAIAARLAASGAGLVLHPRGLTPGRIARALERLLQDPAIPPASARMAEAVRAAGGTARAADIVEAVLRTGRPVPA